MNRPREHALVAQVNQELAQRGCTLVVDPKEWVRYHLRPKPRFLPLQEVARDYHDSPRGTQSAAAQLAHDIVRGHVQILDTVEALLPSPHLLET